MRVVGHDNLCHSLVGIQLLEQLHHLHARLGVESTCRFVGKDDLWFGDECPRYGDTLFLSTRQLVGIMLRPVQ